MKRQSKPKKSRREPPTGPPLRPFLADLGQVLLLYALSALLLCWIFPPNGLWPLVFVALVPWTFGTCRAHRAWLVHWLSYFAGFAFFLVALRWLRPVTAEGWVALAAYLAIYWTLAAWAIRTARRHNISPIWSLPVVWVGCEFLRAIVMTGFPWLFLAHSLYEQLSLIQISDITGAYGVSFLAALVNGVLVEFALRRWRPPAPHTSRRQVIAGVVAALLLLAATLGYGHFRLNQVDFEQAPAARGPRVAVIQEDFPLRSTFPYGAPAQLVLARYLRLAAEAAQENPDLIVFPETVWSSVQNLEFVQSERATVEDDYADTWIWGNACHEALSAFARGDYPAVNVVLSRHERGNLRLPRLPATGGPPCTVVVGSVSFELFPKATYPKVKRYNSALVYDPDGQQRLVRYDKQHLVPFGEVVPFRYGRLHFLYRELNKLSPFSRGGTIEYSLTPGVEATIFDLATDEGTYRFAVPICYEDVTPYIIREAVWEGARRRTDFLVSISNDAWFLYSNELPQHLAICAFRAVENRVGIARAVNTGISGFIDPNGRIYSRVADSRGRTYYPHEGGVVDYDLERVILGTRGSLYGRFGDWFAGLCLLASVLLWIGGVFERWVMALKHRIELMFPRMQKGD